MSQNRGRRRIRAGAPGRVGEPNALSNAATPNTLSGMVAQPAPIPGNSSVRVTPSGAPASWLATGGAGVASSKPGFRLPSLGTLIFIGFLAITGVRLVGEFVQGLPSDTPAPTTAPTPVQSSGPGPIEFGTKSDGNCGVLETGLEFAAGTSVWWSAQLSTTQSPDATVVIIVRRDGTEVDHEDVPPDSSTGTWSVLCSGAPVAEQSAGLYRVEVWDETVTVLHAVGEYRLLE